MPRDFPDDAPRRSTRRRALRALALLGTAAPVLLTLRPAAARAQGSWAGGGLRDPGAGQPDLFEPVEGLEQDGWVMPYGYEWRKGEEARRRREEARRRQGY
jgi:hypothetical protein